MSWLRCLGGFDLDSFRKDSKSLKVSSRLHLIRGKLDREASDSDTLSVLLVDQKTILLNHHEILARQEMYWHVCTKSRYPNPNPEYLWTSMIARHFKKWGQIKSNTDQDIHFRIPQSIFFTHMLEPLCIRSDRNDKPGG